MSEQPTEQPAPEAALPPEVQKQLDDTVESLNKQLDDARVELAAAAGDKPVRFAAFDKTYEKFLPGVFETKAAASKAAKGFKGDVGDVEIREV